MRLGLKFLKITKILFMDFKIVQGR